MNKKVLGNTPTVLVVFGATGDLMAKKIIPAFYRLFSQGLTPDKFRVVGLSRQDISDNDFRLRVSNILRKHKATSDNKKQIPKFSKLFSYTPGLFQKKEGYEKIKKELAEIDRKWGMCSNKLFYLAVPPQFYEVIFRHLAASGLTEPCSPKEGWTRVIVEKPFGKNLKTARNLDRLLSQLFREEQIYRIDHYLAKEMIQNVFVFRFTNNLFEKTWNNEHIERIDVILLESLGVEKRGGFYDNVGALQDVGANHLLQMLALITMEYPEHLTARRVREQRTAAIRELITPTAEDIKTKTFRAQYKGYRTIQGVHPRSKTETYFKIETELSSARWRGVPITFESGKRLGKPLKKVVVTFKHPSPCFCQADEKEHYKNRVTFHLEPKLDITISFWSKQPGLTMKIGEEQLHFMHEEEEVRAQYVGEYEKLLLDCISGDQTLFVSSEEIEASWKFIDPIVRGWQRDIVPLHIYKPDQDSIRDKAQFTQVSKVTAMRKEIGIIGLGKMGANIARKLLHEDWKVVGFNKYPEATKKLEEEEGLVGSYSIRELIQGLSQPRLLWLMVPAGKPVDEVIFGKEGLAHYLAKGDIIIDGGNSFYKNSIARYKKLKRKGIHFIDVGVSGGPEGALNGACLMIGGEKGLFKKYELLFDSLAIQNGYQHFEGAGMGHFVKMVHNGIEYGMMQAFAEGFAIMKKLPKANLDLTRIADIYNHGSVIESRLVEWLKKAFEEHGEELRGVSGRVGHTGEGKWTAEIAQQLGVPAKIIEESFKFRIRSRKKPSYTGKILSALRNQFGKHSLTP